MRSLALWVSLAALAAAGSLRAQSLASRITQTDGPVQVIFPSRPDACGDGTGMLSLHSSHRMGDDYWQGRCVHGPARVVATVMSGEITRLRTYVGPVPSSGVLTLNVSAPDARAWLAQLVTSQDHSPRVAQDAMLPLVLADAGDPSPILLAVARDDRRPTNVRRAALTHLANEVNEHLGIADARADTDDDELRRQAVFVLSQQGHGKNTDELIELARSATHPAARRDAIFWLGQSGDIQRVADLYAELLR